MSMNKAVVNVMGHVIVYITNSGEMTVADVKKWLDAVEELGIPDDTRLDNGTLKLTYRAPHVSKIHCGDCQPQSDHTGFSVFGTTCGNSSENQN